MVVQICLRRILVTMRCQEVLQYDGDAIVTRSHSHNLSLFAVPLSRKRMRILIGFDYYQILFQDRRDGRCKSRYHVTHNKIKNQFKKTEYQV